MGNATWRFDGQMLYAPEGVTSRKGKNSWAAKSGGVTVKETGSPNVYLKDGKKVYTGLPSGKYKILFKKSTIEELLEERSAQEQDIIKGTKKGLLSVENPTYQDSSPKKNGWVMNIVAVEIWNTRGLEKLGGLAIHPDGPSKRNYPSPHHGDGTEGCIGIQEEDTADLMNLFIDLEKSKKLNDTLIVDIPYDFTSLNRYLKINFKGKYTQEDINTFTHNLSTVAQTLDPVSSIKRGLSAFSTYISTLRKE